jgi:hypothetical protein
VLPGANAFDAGVAETLQSTSDRFPFGIIDPGLWHHEDVDLPEQLFGVRWNLLSENGVMTGQSLKCLDISPLGALDNVGGQSGRRRLMVPP